MSGAILTTQHYDRLDQEHHAEAMQLVDTLEAKFDKQNPLEKHFAAFYGERRNELLAMLGVALSKEMVQYSAVDSHVREATDDPFFRDAFTLLFLESDVTLGSESPLAREFQRARDAMNRLFWWSSTSVRSVHARSQIPPFAISAAKAREWIAKGQL